MCRWLLSHAVLPQKLDDFFTRDLAVLVFGQELNHNTELFGGPHSCTGQTFMLVSQSFQARSAQNRAKHCQGQAGCERPPTLDRTEREEGRAPSQGHGPGRVDKKGLFELKTPVPGKNAGAVS